MATYHTLVFDVENVVGQPLPGNNGSPATASIWYDRDIILTSGALIPANTVVVTDIPSTGTASAQVIPADDPDVASASQGFGIIVLIQWESGSGPQYQRYSRQYTAQVLSADAATVNLSAKIGAEPMQQSMETVQEVFNQAAAAGIQGPAGPAGPAGPPPTDANVSPILEDSTSQSYAAVQSIAQQVAEGRAIRLADHVAPATTDQTAALNSFFAALPAGAEVLINKGTWRVDGTVTIPQDNITVRLRDGAVLDRTQGPLTPSWESSTAYAVGALVRANNYTLQCTIAGTSGATAPTPPTTLDGTVTDGNVTWERVVAPEAASCLTFTGANVTLKGRGQITSQPVWDGLNTQWSNGVVTFTGASPTCRGITLAGVVKYGLCFANVDAIARCHDVTITGNYPSDQWTEIETGHCGINYDPYTTQARLQVRDCWVDSCVQGILAGNLGAGSSSGSSVSGSTFTNCWNHGIYNSGGITDCVINGNTFYDCSRQITMSDSGHAVTGNTMTTSGTGGDLNAASINMRNPVDCIVSDNVITGDCWTGAAIIDLNHVSGGVVCTGNQVRGNRINMTGTNTGFAIRVGTTATTTWANNTVQGNIVEGVGTNAAGLISVFSAGGGTGGKVKDNTVTVTGNAYGIYGYGMIGAQFTGNTYINAYNAPSAVVVGGVVLAGTCTSCEIKGNQFITQAGYGANSTIRCIWENGAGVTSSRIASNTFALGSTTATTQSTHVLGAGGPVIDEVMDAAPAFIAGPGSQVRVTTGGAGTTLYIKETAANSATWRAI